MNLFKILGIEAGGAHHEKLGSLFAKLDSKLSGFSDAEVKYITGLTGLLGKVAYSDQEISDEEIENMRQVLHERTQLSEKQISAVIDILSELVVDLCGVEDHYYYNILNEQTLKGQKKEILESLFFVAAANNSISSEEDTAIARVAEGLKLVHKDFIEIRSKFKEHLDVLKNAPSAS